MNSIAKDDQTLDNFKFGVMVGFVIGVCITALIAFIVTCQIISPGWY